MIRKLGITLAVACVILLALVACSGPGAAPKADLTVETAKATVLAEGQRLVAAIPEEYVQSYHQLESAHLLSCAGERYKWPDQGTVSLKGDPNISMLLVKIEDTYAKRPGFSARIDSAWDGRDLLVISADEGSHYYVSAGSEGKLHVDSFSACFTLDDDQWPGDAY
jgi:hypothetical protein